MKFSQHPTLILLLFLFMSYSCKPLFKVQTESIASISPSKYRSFKFFNPDNMPLSNFSFTDNNKKIIYDAVANQMKIRGFTSIQESDLIIKVQGGTSRESTDKSMDNYYDPVFGNFTPYMGSWYNDPWLYDDISKKTTTLIIDVLDARTRKLLWEGVGTGVLGDKPSQVEQRIRGAVTEIFTKFPIPPKSSK